MIKFSIITVVKNRVSTIENAIKSILQQDYKNYEIIIVDGCSSDGTLEILNKYKKKIKTLISEKDVGVYHAMNKGLKHTTGDVICFLNSDDFFAKNNILSSLNDVFQKNNCDIVYGEIVYITNYIPPKIVRYWKNNFVSKKSFLLGHHPPHPAFFAKKKLYDEFGNFNVSLPIIADFDLMLRFFNNCNDTFYLRKICVIMRLGGVSNKSLSSVFLQNKKLLKLLKGYGGNFNPVLFIITKLFVKTLQYFFAIYENKKIKKILNFKKII